jgi:ribose 5-phosphate isomerase A
VSEVDPEEIARSAAAAAAAMLIEPGMTLGLGSGRAVWRVIEKIAERFGPNPPLRGVFASNRTHELARAAGIETAALDGHTKLDLALDGTDEIDAGLGLLKGGGGALLREKIVVASAGRFVVVAEARKRVERLGQTRGLPVEIVRFGWPETRLRLLGFLPTAELRRRDRGEPYVTDEGHLLCDCDLPPEVAPTDLAVRAKQTVGVVEHGLFLDMADTALLGRPDGGVDVMERADVRH